MTSALTARDSPPSALRTAPQTLSSPPPRHTRPPETTPRDAAATLILITRGAQEPHEYANLIDERGSAYDVLLDERLKAAPQTSFFDDPESALHEELTTIERQIREWRFQGTQLLTVLDARYPVNLRAQDHRPPLLFVAGRLKPRDDTAVAIIGCPEAARAEIRCAEEVAQGLAAQKRTVISGLSAGVDTAVHLATLKRGGRTIAVIGTGVSLCYPRANVILQRRIAAECAVVSQFMPDAAPTAATFAQRIPVMCGLATATIVVAANPVGTIRAHAEQAAATGRPLVLLEPVLRHKWARELAESPTVTVALTSGGAVDAVA